MTPWKEIVGLDFARRGEDRDTVGGVRPGAVVRPGTIDEVQAVVRAAATRGAALVPMGRGAHLEIGAPPRRLDVLLVLDRLDRVLEHEPADMTVTAEAGCPLGRLQETLGTGGQWLPLDPPLPDRTTLGGLVAANLSGPLRASQGTVRDLLLGVRLVDAEGAVVAGGGKVVKNVAGYDLPKLHTGALGTLGVLVEVTFKVRPRPACESAVVVACRTPEQAADTALAFRDAWPVLWLEAAGAGGLADGPGDGAAVAAGLGGLDVEVAAGRARLESLAAARALRAVFVADGTALRTRLAAFDVEPAAAVLRAALRPTEIGAVMAAADQAARAAGTAVRCLAHAANGVVRIAVAERAAVAAVVATLRPDLEAAGGSLVVTRTITAVDPWGTPPPAHALMRGVKAALDPSSILAPGRHVGGL